LEGYFFFEPFSSECVAFELGGAAAGPGGECAPAASSGGADAVGGA
jgi:hypothetical protein